MTEYEFVKQSAKRGTVPLKTVLVHEKDAERLALLGKLLNARHTGPKREGNMSAGLRFLVRVIAPDIIGELENETETAQAWKREKRYLWDGVSPADE